MRSLPDLVFTIPSLHEAYRQGTSLDDVLAEVMRRVESHRDNPIWIRVLSDDELAPYIDRLSGISPDALPLYGVPFAIKDNIDLAGIPTTAACAAFEYVPAQSAFAVQCLIDAGAIPIGKTNLDQFATGLVGTRSPWGAVKNAFDDAYISGGSSAGSAVAVALGEVAFSLGTDTAGSGRVPAAFNNLIGLKPTRGLISATGVVPACRTLDCVSIFALTIADADRVCRACDSYDIADPYARRKSPPATPTHVIGIPRNEDLEFFGDDEYRAQFAASFALLEGFQTEEIDISPLVDAARLLYEGAWVAERYHGARELIEEQPEVLRDEFLAIVGPASKLTAVDYFSGAYALAGHRRQAEDIFSRVDALVLPTAPTHFSIAAIDEEPLSRNAQLGYYTNFMNLLDLCGLSIPTGFVGEGRPFGVTLVGDAMNDSTLSRIARQLLAHQPRRLGATGAQMTEPMVTPDESETMPIAVCGAHLTGMPLNTQLSERGATLREATVSAAAYRLYALPGGPPFRPGMVRDETGSGIEVEVFDVPILHVGSFLAGIPAPLGLGKVELASGEWVTGFICEPCGIEGAEDITHLGGWRAYMATR